MAWVIEGRRSDSGRPLPSSRIPSSPLFVAVLAIAAVSLLIAVAFALAGAWLVLPFAGLELAGLSWAIHRHARSPAGVAPEPIFPCLHRTAVSRVCPHSIAPFNLRRKPF